MGRRARRFEKVREKARGGARRTDAETGVGDPAFGGEAEPARGGDAVPEPGLTVPPGDVGRAAEP